MIINVNGIALFYQVCGQGGPLILLHGNGEDHHIFDPLSQKLAQTFTVYAVDSRNHGKSQKTTEYSYQTMSEDLYAFIKALNLNKPDIIGFSDGAIITLMLAMHHKNAVGKMALLGINLKPDDFTPECLRDIQDTYHKTKDPILKLMLEEPDIQLDDVRNLSVPALIMAGENDVIKQSAFTGLAEALPDAQLKILQGHDHDSYLIGQDTVYQDLIRFFT